VHASSDDLIASRASAGIFVDFDGTLSHIVDVPSAARPAEGAAEALALLAEHFALVAIVSGRGSTELLEWLGPELEIWGVHGAERATAGVVTLAPEVRPYIPVLARVRAEAEAALRDPAFEGCLVEDKGVAVALHYRMATSPDAAERLQVLADSLAETNGLLRTDARMAFELRPPVDVSKRSVVLNRARELDLTAAAFLGDDVVDLSAFDALDELGSEGRAVLRVAVRSDEAPEELLDRADVVVEGVVGAVAWLRDLARGAAEE
jgi:trehalose 6-phosphate phosphatase